jgi:hypothetical protein
MADFEVKVRNLETGEMLVASMPDCDTCVRWLAQRPRNVEIVTVLSATSGADRERLHAAMRPYDADELALKRRYDEARSAAAAAAYAEAMAKMQAEPAEDPNADPLRPMSIRYEVDAGLSCAGDSRPITQVVRDAVAAWVAERNEWIAGRGQIVGEAHIDVWPGEVPPGESRVCEGGRFYPRLED